MDKSEQASTVYDKIAEAYAKEFSEPSENIDELLKLMPKNGKILDVGCGVGIDANYINSKGYEIIGIDLSKKMIELAKQKFPSIEFRIENMLDITFPKKYFDGIVASFSLIHIAKKEVPKMLNKFQIILKKGGILYIALQSGKSEEIFINEPFKPDEKIFLNIISFQEIKELLTNNGFSIIKTYERQPQTKEEFGFIKLVIIAKKY